MNGTLAVAALSARLLSESACRGGYRVVAMDLFGDVDTRRVVSAWTCIGEPVKMKLDAACTMSALQALACAPNLVGWIAGSGFEAMPDVLMHGSRIARLIGNDADTLSRVRDVAQFFARLDALGIAHPPTSSTPPSKADGWLVKDATGSGAWHIRPACDDALREPLAAGTYYQRRIAGRSLGALFVANGRDARIIGFAEQTIRARHGHPFVYCGTVGPVHLPAVVAARLHDAVRALVDDMQLVGLNSFDFLLDGDDFFALEVNARPSSSLALYDAAYDHGLVRAHVDAACDGALPEIVPSERVAPNGNEIVFAERRCRASAAMVARQLDAGWCHDIGAAGTLFTAGEPICTVSAHARSLADVRALLAQRRDCVASWLEEADG